MRLTGIAVALLLGLALALGAATGGKPATPPAGGAAPPPPAALQARVSQLGLEGISELYVQVDLLGDGKWVELVGTTREELKARAEERVGRIAGIEVLKEQSLSKPRLIVQVVGHVMPGYDEADPPTATSFMLAVSQPVTLNRPGPGGNPIVTSGITACTNLLITRRGSATKQSFEEKVAHLLDEFEQEYRNANPQPAATPKS